MRASAEAPARAAADKAARRAAILDFAPQQMPAADALWVLDNVLVFQAGIPAVRCACLHGPCGPCAAGACRPGRTDNGCLNVVRPAAWYGTTEGWILDRRGMSAGRAREQVWLSDRTCRYRCPCSCCAGEQASPEPLQLDLFGAVA